MRGRRTKPATRNQAQIPANGSLLPLWEKARMRVSPRPSAAPLSRRPRSQRQVDAKLNWAIIAPPLQLTPAIPAKAGIQTSPTKPSTRNQAQIPANGSLLPLREKARMRVRRAQARLRRRAPRAPTTASLPSPQSLREKASTPAAPHSFLTPLSSLPKPPLRYFPKRSKVGIATRQE